MGLISGEEEELFWKEEPAKEVNPIDEEIVLEATLKEHSIVSKEMIKNKKHWCDTITKDMYSDNIPEVDGNRVYSEFFSTLVTDGSIPSANGTSLSGSHREYVDIHDYPIYIQGELNTNTSAKDQKTDTSSTAVIHGVLPPQTSDYFTLPTGVNRVSLFKIKSVKPLSILIGRAYEIEFIMCEVNLAEMYADLIDKSVRKLSYIRKNHQLGVKYLLSDGEIALAMASHHTGTSLHSAYVSEFYNTDLKVFGVTSVHGFHTDMIVQDFVSNITLPPEDMYTYPEYAETSLLDTIFDALLYGNGSITSCMNKVYYYLLNAPTDIPNIHPILTSPISSMPFQAGNSFMKVRTPPCLSSSVHNIGYFTVPTLSISEIFDYIGDGDYTIFPNVLGNSNYLFSEEFYRGEPTCLTEVIVYDMVRRRPLRKDDVYTLIDNLYTISSEERFFVMPFVLLMLKCELHE